MFGYYCEAYGNGIRFRNYFEGYKTERGARKAAERFRMTQKCAETGHVIFKYVGGKDQGKYTQSNYIVLDRFNAKAFFDFWG